MANINKLSRVIFPQTDFIDSKELFVNKSVEVIKINNINRNVIVSTFDTWMNLLPAKKYYKYCDLGDLYLSLNIVGSYIVRIIGCKRNAAFDVLKDVIFEQECSNAVNIKIPNAELYDGIYFELVEDIANRIEILDIYWGTNKEPQYNNNLAVVTCTYKRENFINKNVQKLEQYLIYNPELKGKIKMFISDNGKTLPTSLNSENVVVYPNMNAGGAGGFTRGLIEILKLDQGFNRIIFMDDDVQIFMESIHKTLLLSNFLKNEYKDAFINGAMLNLNKKTEFYENLAVEKKLWVEAYHKPQKLKLKNILEINNIPDNVFNNIDQKVDTAWWYHCFDISIVHEKGLPVPVFFRGDDVEWSWRNFGKHHISMNGICIWHSPFEYRVSKLAEYFYLPRNMFMLHTLYSPKFKKKVKKLYRKYYSYLLQTYDYASLEIFVIALKEILKGAKAYTENPETQFIKLNNIIKNCVEKYKAPFDDLFIVKNMNKRNKKWRYTVSKLTNNGLLCPDFLFKKSTKTLDWFPSKKDFALVKEVYVYNLLTEQYEIRKFDRQKIFYYKRIINKLLEQIDKQYYKLHNELVETHKEFTTVEFWEKYLELDKAENKRAQEVH